MVRGRFEENLNVSQDVALAIEVWVTRTDHLIIPDPQWGRILKGAEIDSACEPIVEKIRDQFYLEGLTSSVAIGVMEAGAFHPPFIRNVAGVPNAVRVYKILAGGFTCLQDRVATYMDSSSDVICIGNGDVFSFKAGDIGCVYTIVDFPAFSLEYDANDITSELAT
ncbi:MAG TPA: hypothetical protein PLV59_01900 [Candidatus Dojkabacteria bacterium]|nr:hypothetical protein [Candidatus Dojkabacteria bacterium]